MGRQFNIGAHFRPKPGTYPWPCKRFPDRTINLFDDDVLTLGDSGYTKHTGICCVGIQVPEDCLTVHPEDAWLEIM